MAAAIEGHHVIHILIERAKSIDVDVQKILTHSDYVIPYAAENKDHEVIKILLEYTKDIEVNTENAMHYRYNYAFWYATKNTNHNVIKALFEHVKDVKVDVKKLYKVMIIFQCCVQ